MLLEKLPELVAEEDEDDGGTAFSQVTSKTVCVDWQLIIPPDEYKYHFEWFRET